jgi:hypothetical protein
MAQGLAFAVPFAFLAWWSDRLGWVNPTTTALEAHAHVLISDGWGLGGLADGYPPITVAFALLPGMPLAYGIASAVATGWLVQLLLWQLVRYRAPVVPAVAGLLVLLAAPAVWYEGSQRFDSIMSLALLILATQAGSPPGSRSRCAWRSTRSRWCSW